MIFINRSKIKKSIAFKFFLPIFTLLTVGFLIILWVISSAVEKEAVNYVASESIRKGQELVVDLEANYLNDLESFKKNNYSTERYETVVNLLDKFKGESYLYLYLTYLDDDGNYKYLVDADYVSNPQEDVEFSELFELVEDVDYIPNVYETGEAGYFNSISEDDVWGKTISAYLPVKNDSGDIVSVLGIDSNLDVIYSLRNRLLQNFIFCMSLLIIGVLMVIIFSFNNINKKIIKIGIYMDSVGHKDLSKDLILDGEDELDKLGKTSYESVRGLSSILNLIRGLVKGTSSSIITTNDRIDEFSEGYKMIQDAVSSTSDKIEDITASSQEIVASTEEISSQISRINVSCVSLAKNIEEITSSNKEGTLAVRELNSTIDYTQKHIKSSLINNINYISDSMMTIVPTIMSVTDIASQINLLSLNASIEAARAGKSGAGFSVIAEEIRRLSTETDMIAKEIISNINKLNSDISATQEVTKVVEDYLVKQQDKAVFVDEMFSSIYETLTHFAETFESFKYQVDFIDEAKESLLLAVQNISTNSEETYGSIEEIRNIIATKENDIKVIKDLLNDLNVEMDSLSSKVSEFKTE